MLITVLFSFGNPDILLGGVDEELKEIRKEIVKIVSKY